MVFLCWCCFVCFRGCCAAVLLCWCFLCWCPLLVVVVLIVGVVTLEWSPSWGSGAGRGCALGALRGPGNVVAAARHHQEAVHGRRSWKVTCRGEGALPLVVGWALWVPASTCVRQKQRSGRAFAVPMWSRGAPAEPHRNHDWLPVGDRRRRGAGRRWGVGQLPAAPVRCLPGMMRRRSRLLALAAERNHSTAGTKVLRGERKRHRPATGRAVAGRLAVPA